MKSNVKSILIGMSISAVICVLIVFAVTKFGSTDSKTISDSKVATSSIKEDKDNYKQEVQSYVRFFNAAINDYEEEAKKYKPSPPVLMEKLKEVENLATELENFQVNPKEKKLQEEASEYVFEIKAKAMTVYKFTEAGLTMNRSSREHLSYVNELRSSVKKLSTLVNN